MSTKAEEANLLQRSLEAYTSDEETMAIAHAAAAVEAEYYCQEPRAAEIIHFAKKMNYSRIGIANCIGLMAEAQSFARIVTSSGLIPLGIACKIGRTDKTFLGIPEEGKLHPGNFEAMCNPVLQAMMLNNEAADLNIIIGLCMGHDCLFTKYSAAPVSTLVVKDRVLAHNPVGALYNLDSYCSRLLRLNEV